MDILINNAARNPKVEGGSGGQDFSRLENFPWDQWQLDLDVGLGGAFEKLRQSVWRAQMAAQGKGVIVNIASDHWA